MFSQTQFVRKLFNHFELCYSCMFFNTPFFACSYFTYFFVKLLFLGHRSLIKNKTQTAVIHIELIHNQNEQVQYVYHCCLCLIFTYFYFFVLYLYLFKNFYLHFRLDNDRSSVETSRAVLPLDFTSHCFQKPFL